MTIKYNNEKGLNERKSNQSSQHLEEGSKENFSKKRFGDKDQEKIESIAGEQGVSSGDSFDKYPQGTAEDRSKNVEGKAAKKVNQMNGMKKEDPSKTTLTQTINHNNRKQQIEKQQEHKPRDNA